MKCKLCDNKFNETEYDGKCPACGEKYYIISMTEYQKLVEELQNKQYEIEQLYNQATKARFSSNKFKNTLDRESSIYTNFHIWLESILKEKNYWNNPHYNKPIECQIHRGKICNGCGDC